MFQPVSTLKLLTTSRFKDRRGALLPLCHPPPSWDHPSATSMGPPLLATGEDGTYRDVRVTSIWSSERRPRLLRIVSELSQGDEALGLCRGRARRLRGTTGTTSTPKSGPPQAPRPRRCSSVQGGPMVLVEEPKGSERRAVRHPPQDQAERRRPVSSLRTQGGTSGDFRW